MRKHNTPKISVIIPIYNVEKYIERCARSLMEQTLDDVEYIFVDDCTPDHSVEILQCVLTDYPDRRNDVKVIHHSTNMGSATVRNTGLKNASGEYVICCDSDDWVDSDAYEAMYLKAEETDADIVATDFYEEFSGHSVLCRQPYPDDSIACVKKMLEGTLHWGTWNKWGGRELYEKNSIHFPDGVNMWEDVLTTIPLIYNARKITYLPKGYYHYVQYNSGAYTKVMSAASLNNLVTAIDMLSDYFRMTKSMSLFEDSFCYMKLTAKLNLLINSRGNQQKEWAKLYPEANSKILFYKHISFYWRLALKIVQYHGLWLFNYIVYIKGKIYTCTFYNHVKYLLYK